MKAKLTAIRQWLQDYPSLACIISLGIMLLLFMVTYIYSSYYPIQGKTFQLAENTVIHRGTFRRKDWLDVVVNGQHEMFNCRKAIQDNLCGNFKDILTVKNAIIKELTCESGYCEGIILQGQFMSDFNKPIDYKASPELIKSYTHLSQMTDYSDYLIALCMINLVVLVLTWVLPVKKD